MPANDFNQHSRLSGAARLRATVPAAAVLPVGSHV